PYARDLPPLASAGPSACSLAPGVVVCFTIPAGGALASTGAWRSHLGSDHSPVFNDWRALFLARIHGATAAGVVRAWTARSIAIPAVCGVKCQCAHRHGDLSRGGRPRAVAAHAEPGMECWVWRVCALGGALGVVCDARLSRCGHPSYAWSGRTSAQP